MTTKNYTPIPVFDALSEVLALYKATYESDSPRKIIKQWLTQRVEHSKRDLPTFAVKDFQAALHFLYSYRGSSQTFGAYRREIERLIQILCRRTKNNPCAARPHA